MLLIQQFALGLSNDKNHDVSNYAVIALLHMITEKNRGPIIRRILDIMDYDSIYIKNKVLDFSEKLKKIDKDAYKFIIDKALVDNHYVIRKRALDLKEN